MQWLRELQRMHGVEVEAFLVESRATFPFPVSGQRPFFELWDDRLPCMYEFES